jgi:hypothetical protein
MGGDDRRPVDNPHGVLLNDDLDVITDEARRDAVADGVDVDAGVVGDPPAEALLAPGQRPLRQGTKRHPLVALKAGQRRFPRRPVDPLIGDQHPLGEVSRGE